MVRTLVAETSSQNPFSTWGNKQQNKQSRMKRKLIPNTIGLLAAVGLWAGASTSANASLEFTASGVNLGSGTALAGKATFTLSGSGTQLTLVLENTGAAARVPSDVMTGVFFNWAGVSMTADSAITPTLLNPESNGNTLGGGWAYKSTTPGGNGTTGIGVWGATDDFFSTTQNTPPLDGIDYGIVSGIADNANNTVKNAPLATPSVTFYFTVLTPNADLNTLTFGGFNYGTSANDQTIIVPEPTTMIAGALLLLPFGMSTIRFIRKNRTA
jgi:hypothetical protein